LAWLAVAPSGVLAQSEQALPAEEAPPFLADRGALRIVRSGEDYLLDLRSGGSERWARVGNTFHGPDGLRFDKIGSEYIGSNGDRYSKVGTDWYVQRGGKTTRLAEEDPFLSSGSSASRTNLASRGTDTNAAARARATQINRAERSRHHLFRPNR
jgi:hypothetical protein